jgi:hypothetical protein
MKRLRAVFMAGLLVAGSLAGGSASADYGRRYYPGPVPYWGHHHHGSGLGIGAGLVLGSALLWAATRPPPVPVYVPPEPVVMAPVAPPQNNWWYYCRPAGAYYPYVATCATGWEVVPARPAGY